MARNRVIYQSEAVYVTQGVYDGGATAAAPAGTAALTAKNANGIPTGVRNLDRVQSANYSFSISRQDVNQFGELAAIDRIITETPTVSFDTSYVLANFANEHLLGFEVCPSGVTNPEGNVVSCISGLINAETPAYQKDWFVLTTKEGADAVKLTDSGRYESLIGVGNAFISSYSSEASVGGLPTVSVSAEGMNMNFVNLPYSGYNTNNAGSPYNGQGFGFKYNGPLQSITGANPAIIPSNGVKVGNEASLTSAAFVTLGVPSGNAGSDNETTAGISAISALRPGDITLSLAKKTSDSIGDLTNLQALDGSTAAIQGASIADAHIQSYTLSFDLSRSAIQRLGTKFAFARPVDFPITASLSIDAVLSNLTTGTVADIINCDDEYDACIKILDPTCNVGGVRPIVLSYFMRGLKIDSESFSSSIGDSKSVTLDFSTQVGGPDQQGVGVFMSGYRGTEG